MTTTLDARTLMERLIAFPTVSRDSNLDLIDFVEKYLNGHGIESTRVPDETGQKAALYAHVGPQIDGGVVLSGHTDVVPVDGQAWDTDPFEVVEKGDKLYGRGTCDMKGGISAAVIAMEAILEENINFPGVIEISGTVDEAISYSHLTLATIFLLVFFCVRFLI